MADIPNIDCLSMFLRGYWDGCFTIANNSRHYLAEGYCDSPSFTEQFIKIMDNNIHVNLFSDGKHFAINSKKEISKFINLIYKYDSSCGLPRKRALAMLHLYYVEHDR